MRDEQGDPYARRLVKVFADSRREEPCKVCGAPVAWILTAIRRRWVLFDADVRTCKRRTADGTEYDYLNRDDIHWNRCAPIERRIQATG